MPFNDPEKKRHYQKELMATRRADAKAKEKIEIEQVFIEFQGFDLWSEPTKKQERVAKGEYTLPDSWFRN